MMKAFSLAAMACVLALPALAQMTLPGKFEVTDSGSASYTIPIAVVPGAAGLEPKLSLSYDSRSGNGLLGVGWSLSGLPSISRCGRTIAQDGQTGGVAFDANDRFCLDGQRLVATTGTYGADQTEYRTERESFSKVVSYGTAGSGPGWFKVWTKAGLIMEFGNSADSKIEAQGKSSVRVWALNKTSDTKSNYFTVSYSEDNANGEYRPDRIDYTGNGAAAPANSVRFVYEARSDISPVYQGGSVIRTGQRLTKVQAWQAETLVREYRTTYETSPVMGAARLTTLTQCDGANACLPGTAITYTGAGQSWVTQANVGGSDGTMHTWRPFPYDFNGDGRTDIYWEPSDQYGRSNDPATRKLWLSNGDSTFSVTGNLGGADGTKVGHMPRFADFNGDGRTDVFWDHAETNGRSNSPPLRSLWLSNGDGTFAVTNNPNSSDGTMWGWRPFLFDFNGDGKTDIYWEPSDIYGRSNDPATRVLWLSNGDGTFAVSTNLGGADGTKMGHIPRFADFNGDGRTDVFWDHGETNGRSNSPPLRSLWLSNGDGTFSVTNNPNSSDGTMWGWRPFLFDFNGDGKTDVYWEPSDTYGRSNDPATRVLWLSNGNGSFSVTTNLGGADGTKVGHMPRFADFNGDGMTDILWDHSETNGRSNSPPLRSLWLSKGDGTFAVIDNPNGSDGTMHTWRPFLYDFNGDGKTDIYWEPSIQDGRSNDPATRVLWLSNGNGSFVSSSVVPAANGTMVGHMPRFADFNGDGKTDILWDHSEANGRSNWPPLRSLWTFQGYASPANDHLATVTGGMGATTTVTAERINAGSLYTRDTGASACVWPCQDINGPLWVTKEVKSSNGLGGEYRSTYRYAGAKSNAHGRGFLGFRQMTVKDEQTGVEQITTSRQDYPFAGLVASREKKLSSQLLNRSTNSYSATDLGGTRRYPFLTQSLEESWELTGTALPAVTTSYQYDSYGNATQVGVSTGDGHSKTTSNTYSNDAANWLLGRLTRSEVTSTTPSN
jgi:hypothetical protein